MAIESLNITTPLIDRKEFIGEYVNVSDYKELRIAYYSDVQLRLHLEFSIDKKQKGISVSHIVPSDLWRSDTIKIVMPYLRVRLINESFGTTINNNIVVSFFSHSKVRFSNMSAPIGKIEELDIINERQSGEFQLPPSNTQYADPNRPKSPWWRKKKEKQPTQMVSQIDYRLPNLVMEHSVLVGGKQGRIIGYPKGQVGNILAINERGQVQWMNIHEIMDLTKKVENGEI